MSTPIRTALALALLSTAAAAAPATAPATGTPHGNAVPGTPYGNAVPGTPHGNAVPGTPHGNAVPGTPHGNAVPATAPAVVVDFSSPAATMTTLTDAVVAHDMKIIQAAILVTPADQDVADTLFHALDASFHFQDAVLAHFGPDAAKALRSPEDLEAAMAERRRLLKTADVAIHDDSATMTFHPPADSTLHVTHTLLLHKIAGQWKIDAASMFGLDDPTRAAKVRKNSLLLGKIADLMDSTADDIRTGKLTTMQAVRETMMPKLHDLLAEAANAATAPATQPHEPPPPHPN